MALHKGNLVAVKRINKRTIDLNRDIRKELNMVIGLEPSTVNPFQK